MKSKGCEWRVFIAYRDLKRGGSNKTWVLGLSSVVIWQIAPFPRSKYKGRVAGIKLDRSWGKPRGISKRQESNFSRNRTKIYS